MFEDNTTLFLKIESNEIYASTIIHIQKINPCWELGIKKHLLRNTEHQHVVTPSYQSKFQSMTKYNMAKKKLLELFVTNKCINKTCLFMKYHVLI